MSKRERSVGRSVLRGVVVVAFGLLAFLAWAPTASAQSECASYTTCDGAVSDAGAAADDAASAADDAAAAADDAAVAATSSSGNLPYTGSDIGRTLTVGAAAVVVGGAAVWGTRRARANRTPV